MRNPSLTVRLCSAIGVSLCVVLLCTLLMAQQRSETPPPSSPPPAPNDIRPLNNPTRLGQLQEEADAKSTGCIACHGQTDSPTMHTTNTVRLGCTDCHGGD